MPSPSRFPAKETWDGKLELSGRVLFLCTDPNLINQQLNRCDLTTDTADDLRDDVCIDETPMSELTRFADRLGKIP